MRLIPLTALLAGALVLPGRAAAQLAKDFDINRAWVVDSTLWHPFEVTTTLPLKEARAQGRVENETTVLVLDRHGARLALIISQMAYHHVAQGEIAGEPWMVSF